MSHIGTNVGVVTQGDTPPPIEPTLPPKIGASGRRAQQPARHVKVATSQGAPPPLFPFPLGKRSQARSVPT
eukprot:357983-Chlamydomonas_euryale.AAC.1